MEHLLEICVDSLESALAAQEGGADRLELCANLLIGGTSPSLGLVRQVLREVSIPVNVLLRPRFGDFCFTPAEKETTLWEVEQCRALGANGVVLGALLPDGRLDGPFLADCVAASAGMCHTLHRAFDLCRDPFEGLEDAIALGFDTILTSGQQAKAPQGAELLRQLTARAAGRIAILAGSGVGPDNLALLARAGVRQFHFSAKRAVPSPMRFRREGVPMGLPVADEYLREYADAALVRRAKQILQAM
ncbi:copper homeostasis protein CutC [Candidatus Allofournierella merdavium]|uniref:copper homeostasis protein CutC n=1 Tax=Candidatus Allofournierella merdavium TaxID=2838593 RepID=UPI00374E2F7F